MNPKTSARLWEIDVLRGIAIIMMVIYHSMMDVELVFEKDLNLVYGFWKGFQLVTAFLFLLLVGVSLTLSATLKKNPQFFYRRGGKIFLWGMVITVVTRVVLGEGFVVFGVLHLIGIATIMAPFFLRFRSLNLWLGLFIMIIGFYLDNLTFPFYWLFWLGFVPHKFFSFDYFPLLPWFGIILIGIFLGKTLYPGAQRRFPLSNDSKGLLSQNLAFLGKNSLTFYLIHQPVILGIMYAVHYFS